MQDGWKLILSQSGAHELYNLNADPEEEINIFDVPRPDPGFERYKHYAPQTDTIQTLRTEALDFASRIDDTEGVALLSA